MRQEYQFQHELKTELSTRYRVAPLLCRVIMPELPEVETTCRGIEPHISGKVVEKLIVRHQQLRWPIPKDLPALVSNQTVLSVRRRGKYLLLQFSQGHLLVHLGMSGSLRLVEPTIPPEKHDHVDMVIKNGMVLRYTDPRRFGAWLWTGEPVEEHKLIRELGPEPLTTDFSAAHLAKLAIGRKGPIKTLIMNAHIVVGVGNIYANEALFLAGIHPKRAAGRISSARLGILVDKIKEVLQAAIDQGGTTLKDFVGSDGKPGYFKQSLNVYGRAGLPCVECGDDLREIRLGQRATVFCKLCQT